MQKGTEEPNRTRLPDSSGVDCCRSCRSPEIADGCATNELNWRQRGSWKPLPPMLPVPVSGGPEYKTGV
jgi:hypothetical protein